MDTALPLQATALTRRCDPAQIPFETTAQVEAGSGVLGQARAVEALAFAIGAPHDDCNAFVMGPPGIGKGTMVRTLLAERTRSMPQPSDWVYVNNFAVPHQPTAIELPARRGLALKRDLEQLIADLRRAVPAIFESEEYAQRVEKIDAEFSQRRDKAIAEVGAEAQAHGIGLLRTPAGYVFLPEKDGEVLTPDQFAKLSEEESKRINETVPALQERLEKVFRDSMRARKERGERLAQLNREMVMLAIEQPVADLVRRYEEFPKVVEYLRAVQQDALANADSLGRAPDGEGAATPGGDGALRRYQVNVLVDRSGDEGPGAVFCDHPTYANLVGRIDHVHHLGTLVTDFTLLKAGALHRANGGYLVIDALKLLVQPFAWEALKRALRRREIRIEPFAEWWGISPTVSLEPEPIPLSVRVVLLGERRLYYLLQALDPDFGRLFKVVADFDEAIDRDTESTAGLARLVAGLARRDALLPFGRAAVARIVDEAARWAFDSRKLSADRSALTRLLREADFVARGSGLEQVGPEHVEAAVTAQVERSSRLKLRLQEAIRRGTIMIDTAGAQVGQANGLAMLDVGEFPFAIPARITATTRVGDGQVIDIQREANLAGSIHSKGVMILSQYLAARFSAHRPHSLAASIAFEQTYGPVEGDSASLAELCALLSSLADVPLRQSLAVTGSVNQAGQVQAVGGVNEKIEGFFEVCRERGLTGGQGVIIPRANMEHLMLRDAVVEAAAKGLFHVHPVDTVDEALELLTGMPAGLPEGGPGRPQDTVNGRVARRLRDFARVRAEAVRPDRGVRGAPRRR